MSTAQGGDGSFKDRKPIEEGELLRCIDGRANQLIDRKVAEALCLCFYLYLYLYLSLSISIYLNLSIPIYIYLHLSLSIYLSIHPSIHPSMCLSIYVCLSLYLSDYVYLSTDLKIYLSMLTMKSSKGLQGAMLRRWASWAAKKWLKQILHRCSACPPCDTPKRPQNLHAAGSFILDQYFWA